MRGGGFILFYFLWRRMCVWLKTREREESVVSVRRVLGRRMASGKSDFGVWFSFFFFGTGHTANFTGRRSRLLLISLSSKRWVFFDSTTLRYQLPAFRSRFKFTDDS